MKFFDRLIAINTAIVGFAIVIALLFPSMSLPSIPESDIKPKVADIHMPEVTVPSIRISIPKISFKNPFESNEPHVAGVFAEETKETSLNKAQVASPTSIPTPTALPTPTEIPIADPISIEIPSINATANIVKVGLSADNAMEIPHDFATVGWYYPSGKPGEDGSALLNGHYDDTSGRPAAFYNLKNLKNGDEIIITTANERKYVFAVEDVFSHPIEAFPHDLLYEDLDGQQIKLLTCDGVWSAQNKNYSNRLVVAALLKEVR
jgi:sortase (surface protein transpeptidase)